MPCSTPITREQFPLLLAKLPAGPRRTLFALGVVTGYRVSELISIKRSDLLNEYGELRPEVSIFTSKGKKTRAWPIKEERVREMLLEWLTDQEELGRMRKSSPVFPLTRWQVDAAIKKAAKAAGLRPAYSGVFATHTMRKTFAMNCYLYWQNRQRDGELVEPIVKTQEALTHSSIESTRRYLAFMLGNAFEAADGMYEDWEL